ncbi:ABC transporter substrate-binding protein [Ktedonobacteria bacterium brp13]|nr:ABC transporter substrate-binding protein [Ktedonobacteria bacterium brp13]
MPRKSRRIIVSTLSLLCILAVMLAACGPTGTGSTSNGTPTSTGKPVQGGTWVDAIYEDPNSLIPNGSVETFAYLVDQAIWAPLFTGTPSGAITPGLASEVPTLQNGDISTDQKSITIKLRPNLKWSDGQPLTAKDIDFTWKLWVNPAFGAQNSVGYPLIKSTDITHNNQWITFHLASPFEPFLAQWTDGLLAPMPEHIFGSMKPGDILKSKLNLDPTVSSGPFTMSESKPGTSYTVVRNPNYYQAAQGLPHLDKIVFSYVSDQDTILKDVQAGSVNSSWFLDVTKTSSYKALSNYSVVTAPSAANFEALSFNLHNPVLQDVNIRKAIAMAIDHQTLITTARHGEATALCTDHPSAFNPGYQANAPCPAYDPAGAKKLLEQDGYKLDANGIYAKNGKELSFNYSTTSNNPWRAEDEVILQQDFKAIGIQIKISNYPGSTFFGTFLPQGKSNYDLGEFENSFTYDADDATLGACSQIPTAANNYSGQNFSFYCNRQLDQLYTQEQGSFDAATRQQAFNQIHQIYLTQFPFVFLYAPVDIAVVKSTGHNYNIGSEGSSETVNVMNWWCTAGKC